MNQVLDSDQARNRVDLLVRSTAAQGGGGGGGSSSLPRKQLLCPNAPSSRFRVGAPEIEPESLAAQTKAAAAAAALDMSVLISTPLLDMSVLSSTPLLDTSVLELNASVRYFRA